MNVSEKHEMYTMKILDMVFFLHGADRDYPYEHLPYAINKLGIVRLSKALKTELTKDGDGDLVVWARQNIASLFI